MKKIIFNFESMPTQRIKKRTQCMKGCNNGGFELHKFKIFTCCNEFLTIIKGVNGYTECWECGVWYKCNAQPCTNGGECNLSCGCWENIENNENKLALKDSGECVDCQECGHIYSTEEELEKIDYMEMGDFFMTGHADDEIAGWFWNYHDSVDDMGGTLGTITIKGEIIFDGKTYAFKWPGDSTKKLQQYTIKELPIESAFPTEEEIYSRINVLTEEWNIQWDTEELIFE